MFSSRTMFILALLAFACFAALVTLQVMEWNFYRETPGIWPGQP